MKKKLTLTLLIFTIFLQTCKTLSPEESSFYIKTLYKQADIQLKNKNFKKLRKTSQKILNVDYSEYKAAYYKAIALSHLFKKPQLAINWYQSYIFDNKDIPEKYKMKLIEFSMTNENNISKKNLFEQEIFKTNIDISTDKSSNIKELNYGKIISKDNHFFILNHNKKIISINKITKKPKIINFYNSTDFIFIDENILFFDNNNLIHYSLETEQYDIIKKYNTKYQYFYQYIPEKGKIIISYYDNIINKQIDYFNFFEFNLKKLPLDYIDFSHDLNQFIMCNDNQSSIFDFSGKLINHFDKKIIGFTTKKRYIYNKDGFYYEFDSILNTDFPLFFIQNDIDLNPVYNNGNFGIYLFNNYILVLDFSTKNYYLYSGNFINGIKNGFFYKNNENHIFYINFNFPHQIIDFSICDKYLYFSDDKASLFGIGNNKQLKVYDLSNFIY